MIARNEGVYFGRDLQWPLSFARRRASPVDPAKTLKVGTTELACLNKGKPENPFHAEAGAPAKQALPPVPECGAVVSRFIAVPPLLRAPVRRLSWRPSAGVRQHAYELGPYGAARQFDHHTRAFMAREARMSTIG